MGKQRVQPSRATSQIIASLLTNKMMEHTLHRISTMTDKQLEQRIDQMLNPKKLAAMVHCCNQLGMRKLAAYAKEALSWALYVNEV